MREHMFDIIIKDYERYGVVIMSNHDGSYMLNKVLYVAKEIGILESIGEEKGAII